ncbi:hypothetical protein B0H13DRAFT_2403975 [Mycena leptocephala]|nr:hypothetical protein B0H13DRAFT_2403975 [Mycena leptocephala]
MDTDKLFKKSELIGHGKAWAATPPALRKVATEFFIVPQAFESSLLPSPFLSIAEMLEFPFPLQNTPSTAAGHAQFFSSSPADLFDDAVLLRVRRLPIPDTKTIHKLLHCDHQAWLDGAQSLRSGALSANKHWPKTLQKDVNKNMEATFKECYIKLNAATRRTTVSSQKARSTASNHRGHTVAPEEDDDPMYDFLATHIDPLRPWLDKYQGY